MLTANKVEILEKELLEQKPDASAIEKITNFNHNCGYALVATALFDRFCNNIKDLEMYDGKFLNVFNWYYNCDLSRERFIEYIQSVEEIKGPHIKQTILAEALRGFFEIEIINSPFLYRNSKNKITAADDGAIDSLDFIKMANEFFFLPNVYEVKKNENDKWVYVKTASGNKDILWDIPDLSGRSMRTFHPDFVNLISGDSDAMKLLEGNYLMITSHLGKYHFELYRGDLTSNLLQERNGNFKPVSSEDDLVEVEGKVFIFTDQTEIEKLIGNVPYDQSAGLAACRQKIQTHIRAEIEAFPFSNVVPDDDAAAASTPPKKPNFLEVLGAKRKKPKPVTDDDLDQFLAEQKGLEDKEDSPRSNAVTPTSSRRPSIDFSAIEQEVEAQSRNNFSSEPPKDWESIVPVKEVDELLRQGYKFINEISFDSKGKLKEEEAGIKKIILPEDVAEKKSEVEVILLKSVDKKGTSIVQSYLDSNTKRENLSPAQRAKWAAQTGLLVYANTSETLRKTIPIILRKMTAEEMLAMATFCQLMGYKLPVNADNKNVLVKPAEGAEMENFKKVIHQVAEDKNFLISDRDRVTMKNKSEPADQGVLVDENNIVIPKHLKSLDLASDNEQEQAPKKITRRHNSF